MKITRLIMGMPVTVAVVGAGSSAAASAVFDYFYEVDRRYSTYKPRSEISRINAGLPRDEWSSEMRWVFDLCDETKRVTAGYFDITRGSQHDPSGLVKGWAIQNAANLLHLRGHNNFFIEAGGDIQASGTNPADEPWRVGIRNPFNVNEIIKVIQLRDGGAVATSGAYIRGDHIYNPHNPLQPVRGVASVSVIAPTIYDADRFATAAYAMGPGGIGFVENTPGLEGYLVDDQGIATMTSGFKRYAV